MTLMLEFVGFPCARVVRPGWFVCLHLFVSPLLSPNPPTPQKNPEFSHQLTHHWSPSSVLFIEKVHQLQNGSVSTKHCLLFSDTEEPLVASHTPPELHWSSVRDFQVSVCAHVFLFIYFFPCCFFFFSFSRGRGLNL